MPLDRDDPAYKGQRDFSPLALSFYDPFVLQFSASRVWHCPLERLLENYRWHIRPNHLDVGPGTGYFLEHAGLPEGSAVTILDPNLNVLRRTAERLKTLDVTAIEADVLKPLPVRGPFGSVGMNLVLHCLPGPMVRKSAAIRNVARVLGPDGLFFGSTVLGESGTHSWVARRLLDLYNGRGAFDNRLDTEEALREILDASFEHVELDVVGSVAIFFAMGPKVPHAEEAKA
jgi:SAM-dependent methyltransferase